MALTQLGPRLPLRRGLSHLAGRCRLSPGPCGDAQEELNLGARADVPWGRDPEAGPGLLCQWEGKQQGALGVLQGRV